MAITVKTRKCDGVKTYLVDFRDQKGRRVRETAGTTRKQAKDLLTRRLGEVRAGTYVNPRDLHDGGEAGPTFSEFAGRFLKDYGSLRRSDYYEQQMTVLKSYFGDKRLMSITRADIDLFGVDRARQTVGKRKADRRSLHCPQGPDRPGDDVQAGGPLGRPRCLARR